jgi:hypothetical protein
MMRLSIPLVLALSAPTLAQAEAPDSNNFGGPISCLRSIAYRAGCPATLDANCPAIWRASARLCEQHRTSDRFAYRLALTDWTYRRFLEQDRRNSLCGEGERVARAMRGDGEAR